jgi:hypothetical protein
LSFKLCRVKKGSSNEKYKSAGLDDLITSMGGLDFSNFQKVGTIEDLDSVVSVLWEIKKKIDRESHGTPQDLVEFEFLSENELREVCAQTLDVVAFLDQIHFEKTILNSGRLTQAQQGSGQEIQPTNILN